MPNADRIKLEAGYAMSLHPDEIVRFDRDIRLLETECWGWTGWRSSQWPAKIIRPGLRFYKFDPRPEKRQLCALLTVTHGGAFRFSSMSEFADKVRRITGWPPDPGADRDSKAKWEDIENRLAGGRRCTGVCLRWQVDKRCSIYLPGKFPRVGWSKLRAPNYGMTLEKPL